MKHNFSAALFSVSLLIGCQTVEQKALEIHKSVLTVDSHCDTPLKLADNDFDLGVTHNPDLGEGRYDFPRMEEGGLDASFFAVFIGQGSRDSLGLVKAEQKANEIFTSIYKAVEKYPEKAAIALSADDAYKLEKEGKRAIYIGIENGYALANKLENIDRFYSMGTRYITLCHTRNNDICDSSTDSAEHNGLSAFGVEVVKRMNKLGIIVDVSHISDSAFYDVLATTNAPVIASHSCARAVCNNPRNLSDDMLRALAKNGGVVQMCILSDYVKIMPSYPARDSAHKAFNQKHSNWANYTDEQRKQGVKEWYQLDVDFPPVLANVSDVVDHIDHMVKVAGIDHVGIGTDFDGGGAVDGCKDVSQMPNITLELVKRGYSKTDIEKIWGRNFMRVFRQVEALKKS